MGPAYGFVCLSCGLVWGPDDGYAKHTDPRTGEKCRDVSGSSSVPSLVGPVADTVWGPDGIWSELLHEARYDHGWLPPTQDAIDAHMADGAARIRAALGPTPG